MQQYPSSNIYTRAVAHYHHKQLSRLIPTSHLEELFDIAPVQQTS